MVRIRLRRVGRKKQPSYRVVVADSRSPRDGRYIEVIGFYNPRTQPATMTLKEDRALHWLSNGAQPSDPVRRILNKLGTWDRFERLKQGEALDTLLQEAEAATAAREDISPKTSVAAAPAKPVLKATPAAEKAEAPEVVAAPEAEAEPEVEAEAEAEDEAEAAEVDEASEAEEAETE